MITTEEELNRIYRIGLLLDEDILTLERVRKKENIWPNTKMTTIEIVNGIDLTDKKQILGYRSTILKSTNKKRLL